MWSVTQLAQTSGPAVASKSSFARLVGWQLPAWIHFSTPGGLFGMVSDPAAAIYMDVVYNIGDAVNKIGFGPVIYSLL